MSNNIDPKSQYIESSDLLPLQILPSIWLSSEDDTDIDSIHNELINNFKVIEDETCWTMKWHISDDILFGYKRIHDYRKFSPAFDLCKIEGDFRFSIKFGEQRKITNKLLYIAKNAVEFELFYRGNCTSCILNIDISVGNNHSVFVHNFSEKHFKSFFQKPLKINDLVDSDRILSITMSVSHVLQ